MRRHKLIAAVAVLVALLATGVAIAAHKASRAHTDPVTASFTVNQERMTEKLCAGQDGQYRQFHAVYRGTSTGDPRLTGNLTLRSSGLVNQDTGFGSTRGKAVVRDASTGRLKAHGHFWAVNTDRGFLHGLILARVHDRDTGGAEDADGSGGLLGNFKGSFNAAGTTFTGQLGGTSGDDRTPAVIQAGGCPSRRHR